jgi:hypothetical protein
MELSICSALAFFDLSRDLTVALIRIVIPVELLLLLSKLTFWFTQYWCTLPLPCVHATLSPEPYSIQHTANRPCDIRQSVNQSIISLLVSLPTSHSIWSYRAWPHFHDCFCAITVTPTHSPVTCGNCHLLDPKVRCNRKTLNITETPVYAPGDLDKMFGRYRHAVLCYSFQCCVGCCYLLFVMSCAALCCVVLCCRWACSIAVTDRSQT